jgi:hypothetical protein
MVHFLWCRVDRRRRDRQGLTLEPFEARTLPGFLAPLSFDTDSGPYAIAVADLVGDGVSDIVTANDHSRTVSVLLGDGHGALQPAVNYAVGTDPVGVAVADLNGDGIPDIVTANTFGSSHPTGSISVLLGNGDGTFQPAVTMSTDHGPRSVAVADLNGDGIPDLAVTTNLNLSTPAVGVLLGNGDGSFQAPYYVPTGGGNPTDVAVADLNGDGIPDLVTANFVNAAVSVLLGNGDGSFQAPENYSITGYARSVVVADLNGDGIPDLATAGYASTSLGYVNVLLGNGDGTFQPTVNYAVDSVAFWIAAADFNGDGVPDLVSTNLGQNDVSLLLGNGDGSFQPKQNYPVGQYPYAVAVGDFDGDGSPDLVTANYISNDVTVLLNDGDWSTSTASSSRVALSRPADIAALGAGPLTSSPEQLALPSLTPSHLSAAPTSPVATDLLPLEGNDVDRPFAAGIQASRRFLTPAGPNPWNLDDLMGFDDQNRSP